MYLHTRYYREWRAMSLKRLARGLGMSPGQLSEKERGLEAYTVRQIGHTVQLLQIPIQYLLEIPYTPVEGLGDLPLPPRERLITLPGACTRGGSP